MPPTKRGARRRPSSAELSRWFHRAREGDRDALQTLLTLYRPLLLSLANARLDATLQLKAAPSDLVQNTLWNATRTFLPENFETRGKFLGWLIKILDNEAARVRRRFIRAKKRDVRREVSIDSSHDNGLLDQLSASLSASYLSSDRATHYPGLVKAAIARLPKHYQFVLRLRFAEKQSFAAIAETLGRSYDGARMLCQRALQRVKAELEMIDPDDEDTDA